MNKLRRLKPPATMYSAPSSTGSNVNQCLGSVETKPLVSRTMQIASWYSAPAAAKPRTLVEQYGAARALVAETVLTTRVQQEMRLGKEEKQTDQFAALLRASEQRQSRLEMFVAALVACFMLLFLALIFILLRDSPKSKGASHFTIPILSPFTSVVEHETGIISARFVSIFIIVLGILSYAIFRHLSRS
ncbi:hypothetical protein BDR04DRAFT_1090285, partial [Suillus decipiens]